jgi:acetylornithine deacetylase
MTTRGDEMTTVNYRGPALDRAREDVVPLLQRLLSFNTDAGSPLDEPHDEEAHQACVAEYLTNIGAEVEVFVPDPSTWRDHHRAAEGQTFEGRPVIWARIPGNPDGRSLLFNGHYDTVPSGPEDDWTHPPHAGVLAGGRVYGRGSCDMKGGIAAALAAASALTTSGYPLPGDVLFNIVPFEEVNGMGTIATIRNGYRADAAVCMEPTGLRPLAGSRGIMELEIEVDGRSGHGEFLQPHHSLGGAVNAIDKLAEILVAIRRLNDQWRTDPQKQHSLYPPPMALPTVLEAGTFWCTWPGQAKAVFDVTYMPADADARGGGARVRAEVERFVNLIAQTDDWMAQHPPLFHWRNEFPASAVDVNEPIIQLAHEIADHPDGVGGLESWGDHVSLDVEGGIPSLSLGPGASFQAHAVDEYVPVDQLQRSVNIYAQMMTRWGCHE